MTRKIFSTPFDNYHNDDAKVAAYEKGLEVGSGANEFHIAVNDVWSTSNKDGSSTFSYEKVSPNGHALTGYFLAGVVDSGVAILDHRNR